MRNEPGQDRPQRNRRTLSASSGTTADVGGLERSTSTIGTGFIDKDGLDAAALVGSLGLMADIGRGTKGDGVHISSSSRLLGSDLMIRCTCGAGLDEPRDGRSRMVEKKTEEIGTMGGSIPGDESTTSSSTVRRGHGRDDATSRGGSSTDTSARTSESSTDTTTKGRAEKGADGHVVEGDGGQRQQEKHRHQTESGGDGRGHRKRLGKGYVARGMQCFGWAEKSLSQIKYTAGLLYLYVGDSTCVEK